MTASPFSFTSSQSSLLSSEKTCPGFLRGIVVTEGMQVRMQRGINSIQAAKETVAGTMVPMLGGTFIAILAFSPIGLSPDDTGEYCRSLFLVVGYSLFLSWVTAITITPLFCHLILPTGTGGGEAADPYGGWLFQAYKRLLTWWVRSATTSPSVFTIKLTWQVAQVGAVKSFPMVQGTAVKFQDPCIVEKILPCLLAE